jgi:hypothetical protein
MRTKTMLLSALLGTLGSVSLMAQSTNVYSLNAVGYINVTIEPGFNLISCPLWASPDNTLNTLLTNANGQFKKWGFYAYSPATGYAAEAIGTASGWTGGGTNVLAPGQAAWLFLPETSNATTVTFVGTVPSGSLTNTILPGFNLVSSYLPTSGNIVTNTLMNFTTQVKKDQVYTYDALTQSYAPADIATATGWTTDPVQANVGGGFWYLNNTNVANNWVENFSVGQ